MSDDPVQETYPPYEDSYGYGPGRCRPRGIVRTALMWAAIAVLAMLAFGTVIWAFGLVFHLAALLLKIALVTAVVAFIWRRVTRRPHRDYDA
jgi:hypothetical protein